MNSAQPSPCGGPMPLVSVVIPAFNAQAHLAECLVSVASQERDFDIEIIVVDDGSTDATAEIARTFAGVRCIVQPNRGPSAARNVGIEAARGTYVAFLDADDLWPTGKLKEQIRILEDHPELGLLFGDCRQFSAQGARPQTEFQANHLGRAQWGPGPVIPDAYARLLEVNFITTGSVIVHRDILQAVGGFAEDLRLVEDLDLWLRIAHRHPIGWCEHECLHRRRHADNISRDSEAMALAFLEVLRRHRLSWRGAEAAKRRRHADSLESRKHIYLAELALSDARPGAAVRRLGRSVLRAPHPRTLWLIAKSTIRQALRRHG